MRNIIRNTLLIIISFGTTSCGFIAFIYGVHKPKIIKERSMSHKDLSKKINAQGEGDFEIVYRTKDFVENTGYTDFYDLDLWVYNNRGLRADLNKTAMICEKSSFGYKDFKNQEVTIDQLIWETDTNALYQLFSGLETLNGQALTTTSFPNTKYYFVGFYSQYVKGPQRRKLRLLRNALDYKEDSITTIYINADYIETEAIIYSQQYEGFTIKDDSN